MTTPQHSPDSSSDALKFAYWVPNVSGGLVISNIEQRTSWTIEYNRKLAQIAEASGFEYALSQIRFTAGYGAEFQHESVAFSHALLESTTTLKVIAALLPRVEAEFARAHDVRLRPHAKTHQSADIAPWPMPAAGHVSRSDTCLKME